MTGGDEPCGRDWTVPNPARGEGDPGKDWITVPPAGDLGAPQTSECRADEVGIDHHGFRMDISDEGTRHSDILIAKTGPELKRTPPHRIPPRGLPLSARPCSLPALPDPTLGEECDETSRGSGMGWGQPPSAERSIGARARVPG